MTNKTDPFDLSAGVPNVDGNLRPSPKFAERISKRVLFVVFGVVAAVAATFLFALDAMDKPTVTQPKETNSEHYGGNKTPEDLLQIGRAKLDNNLGNLITPDSVPPATLPAPAVPSHMPVVPDFPEDDLPPPLTPEQQRALAEAQARYQRDLQARLNGMSGKVYNVEGGATGSDARMAGMLEKAKQLLGNGNGNGNGAESSSNGMGGGSAQSMTDQDQKIDFLAKSRKEQQGYHQYVSAPAISKNEIKTGSFIPMVLEQSINSDLPGQITARVTEDVYDTISGCRMLIPAMSKVVGRYDSKVAIGQNRMLIAWNSLVFKDGAELNLAGLQGYDTSGQAGLESDVDNHYWRLFGLTFGLSMITAGVQLSVPQPNTGADGSAPQSPAQIIAASLAQQYGNLGSQIIGKYMSVQPTLRNFAGERFIVMVPRTIVFNKVWRNRCPGNS